MFVAVKFGVIEGWHGLCVEIHFRLGRIQRGLISFWFVRFSRIVSELLLACAADLDCSDLALSWMIRVNLWYSGSFGHLCRMYWM